MALVRRIIRLGIGLTLGAVLCALLQPADAIRRPPDAADVSIAVRTSAPPPPASPREVAKAAYKHLTPRQRVGQLFMMGVLSTKPSRSDVEGLRNGRGGNVFIFGNNSDGRADVRRVVTRLRHATSHRGVRPFVGVDQEGGLVQHLKGPGFSRMPSAVDQGRLSPRTLRNDARRWGRQLRATGLNLDLAPVADTVPASTGRRNKPIGRLHREYGHTPRRVRVHVAAFVRGMGSAGVETAVKHFPGLGRATGNTDDRRRVTDPTRPGGHYLTPYQAGADAGAQFVMVSSAIYPHIDPGVRACFSSLIMRGLLRKKQGFSGIVVSDSLSAKSVNWLPPRTRAIRFLEAGGTMVLDTDADRLPAMTHAVRAKMRHDHAFAALIRHNVMRVLLAKARNGLIG
ncbi:MAG TPA: glycoside hydrolase family 3 N-terminal domain-containing protein [Nocardioidaceae bacterium]|nr:glycoside hydrolase family 3 N-terminal domain-containing protein [Nocardioidaceae bacterium]